ncbi:hypothetical protein [Micropruina sonneratiae]|uniref:hypothetical protein n=1 Tax=Micropruina sonneratiae TaxID=2986940 RepID=UPI0022271537|nr:hypothetical protein [Micropruina sp. KQZ13P-5]MCW3157408.1 hypothetical protein [Micropruina sp. KQZ13P-5]
MAGAERTGAGGVQHVTRAAVVAEALTCAHRDEWARIVATTIRVTGDWDLAEEVAAVTWPRDGVPERAGPTGTRSCCCTSSCRPPR